MQWDEGLPLGNGFIGSIVYGGSPLKITVDRTDLWDLRPNETTLESGFNFENLKRLAKSGKAEDWKFLWASLTLRKLPPEESN